MSQVKVNPNGKVALVSGSNRGIGKAIAIELLEQGVSKLYAGARNVETLNELTEKYGERVVPIQLDVTNADSVKKATSTIEDLDILVNNAGIFSVARAFGEDTEQSLVDNLEVNVYGVIKLSNALISLLKKDSETAIVNVSSLAALGSMPMGATYSMSKAALHSLTQAMRGDVLEHNISVIGVYPGPIDTDMTAGLDFEKESPTNTAKSIVNGIINGTEDIYPDGMSEQLGNVYTANPKAVEKQLAQFV